MPTTLRVILTVGQIARRLDEPLHRVEYAIRTRAITPSGIAGNTRVFEEEHVEQIASALRDIDVRREADRRAMTCPRTTYPERGHASI